MATLGDDDIALEYGMIVKITGEFSEVSHETVPYNFDYHDYLENNFIYYQVKISKIDVISKGNFLDALKNKIISRINNIDKTGYMKAFIVGIKDDLTIYEDYQEIGVAHLFAISGMHISLFSGLLLKILKKFNYHFKYFIVIIFLLIYSYIIGFTASILRCVIFFIIGYLNKALNFKLSLKQVFFWTIFLILLFNPFYIYDVGFRYSFMCVCGIILFSDKLGGNRLLVSLKVSIITFLFSVPVSLTSFYQINLLSIIYNLFYIPFISFVIYPLSLLSFIFSFLIPLLEVLINILESITLFLTNFKFLTFNFSMDFGEVILYLIGLIIIYKFNKGYFLLFLILLFSFFRPYFDPNGYVYFLDVGQGDSALVISPYRKDVILIDTGGSIMNDSSYVSDKTITLMKALGIKKIDLLILSHGDADHAKEVEHIMSYADIDNLNINQGDLTEYEMIASNLIEGRYYKTINMKLEYLNFTDYDDENANSLLTILKIYDTIIYTFGDATKEAENDLLEHYNLVTPDIYKISHHGSKTSSDDEYLKILNPDLAIISSGRNNLYHHPSEDVISRLEKYSIDYLNTQDVGTIKVTISKKGFTYSLSIP